jgi:hypothetical protein
MQRRKAKERGIQALLCNNTYYWQELTKPITGSTEQYVVPDISGHNSKGRRTSVRICCCYYCCCCCCCCRCRLVVVVVVTVIGVSYEIYIEKRIHGTSCNSSVILHQGSYCQKAALVAKFNDFHEVLTILRYVVDIQTSSTNERLNTRQI